MVNLGSWQDQKHKICFVWPYIYCSSQLLAQTATPLLLFLYNAHIPPQTQTMITTDCPNNLYWGQPARWQRPSDPLIITKVTIPFFLSTNLAFISFSHIISNKNYCNRVSVIASACDCSIRKSRFECSIRVIKFDLTWYTLNQCLTQLSEQDLHQDLGTPLLLRGNWFSKAGHQPAQHISYITCARDMHTQARGLQARGHGCTYWAITLAHDTTIA